MGGHLVLSGRAKDTIVLCSGKNVEPQPIEDALQVRPGSEAGGGAGAAGCVAFARFRLEVMGSKARCGGPAAAGGCAVRGVHPRREGAGGPFAVRRFLKDGAGRRAGGGTGPDAACCASVFVLLRRAREGRRELPVCVCAGSVAGGVTSDAIGCVLHACWCCTTAASSRPRCLECHGRRRRAASAQASALIKHVVLVGQDKRELGALVWPDEEALAAATSAAASGGAAAGATGAGTGGGSGSGGAGTAKATTGAGSSSSSSSGAQLLLEQQLAAEVDRWGGPGQGGGAAGAEEGGVDERVVQGAPGRQPPR